LEEVAWQSVEQLLRQPKLILEHYHQWQHQAHESSLEYQEQRRLSQQLERLHAQPQRLLDGYQSGVLELEELQRRQERIAEREKLLQERLTAVACRLQQGAAQADVQEGIEAFAQRLQHALENPAFEDKQRILRLVIERIVVGSEEIVVKHSIPLPLYLLETNDLLRGRGCDAAPGSPTRAGGSSSEAAPVTDTAVVPRARGRRVG
jgi:site-specific DNA recombinase